MIKKTLTGIAALSIPFIAFSPAAFATDFNGGMAYTNLTDLSGAAAHIWTPQNDPYVAPYPKYFSTAWVMVQDQTSDNLSQVGWAYEPSLMSVRHYFYGEFTNGVYGEKDFTYGPASESWEPYQVAIEGSNWVGRVNGVEVGSSSTGWSPMAAFYAEEVNSSSNYYYGSSSDPVKYQDVEYLNGSANSWIVPQISQWYQDSYAGYDYSQWGQNTGGLFAVWDTRN